MGRGADENTNELIRRYITEGTDFSEVTDKQIRQIEDILNGSSIFALNNRPYKRRGHLTPSERFRQSVNWSSVTFAS